MLFVVRPVQPHDVPALARLRATLWPDATLDEHTAEANALAAGDHEGSLPLVAFVAEMANGELAGFVEVGLRSHADGCDPAHPVGYIEGWFVEPARRGQGVGRQLVAQAEEWAQEQGCREMASDTWIDNEGSQKAHEALGYEVVDRCVLFRKSL